MTIEDAKEILREHQVWRRGADIPMVHPKTLGEAIDVIIDFLDKYGEEVNTGRSNRNQKRK